jgi:hypothetical protein
MVIKPNHFHCLIENTITETTVGTDLRVCPCISQRNRQLSGKTKYQGITYYWTNTQVRPYTGPFNVSKQCRQMNISMV